VGDAAKPARGFIRRLGSAAIYGAVPYGEKSEPTENFSFEELDAASPAHKDYLWANPAFLCAMLLAQLFRESGWDMTPGTARDIDDLPMHMYRTAGETKITPGAEVVMTLAAAEKILEQGLMPLISYRDSDRVRLARFQSISAPPKSLDGKWT
jgi:type VI secretion system protein ImpC